MPEMRDVVVLFDVDNTLLDNDRVIQDLGEYLVWTFGQSARDRYWAIFEELRAELGYADYLGALERYRVENLHHPCVPRVANWLIDYPFADRLYPGAVDAVRHAARFGDTVILSDGDAVFQPRKVARSGLWEAFRDRVLIYIHKEQELAVVERLHPAKHYVLVDDKLRILDAVKRVWGNRVTTVFPRQGHYALEPGIEAKFLPADLTIDRIGEFPRHDLHRVRRASEEAAR
jgi:FMN phosphatase YigB (HAD superfamily)